MPNAPRVPRRPGETRTAPLGGCWIGGYFYDTNQYLPGPNTPSLPGQDLPPGGPVEYTIQFCGTSNNNIVSYRPSSMIELAPSGQATLGRPTPLPGGTYRVAWITAGRGVFVRNPAVNTRGRADFYGFTIGRPIEISFPIGTTAATRFAELVKFAQAIRDRSRQRDPSDQAASLYLILGPRPKE